MLPCASRCNCGTIAATPEERLRWVSHVPRGSVPLSLLILASRSCVRFTSDCARTPAKTFAKKISILVRAWRKLADAGSASKSRKVLCLNVLKGARFRRRSRRQSGGRSRRRARFGDGRAPAGRARTRSPLGRRRIVDDLVRVIGEESARANHLASTPYQIDSGLRPARDFLSLRASRPRRCRQRCVHPSRGFRPGGV